MVIVVHALVGTVLERLLLEPPVDIGVPLVVLDTPELVLLGTPY